MMFLRAPIRDGFVSGPCDVKNIAGDVTERLVAFLLEADVWTWDMPGFPVPETVALETDESPYELRPDLWWGKHTAVVEVKSGIARFYVTQRQWASYLWLRDRSVNVPIYRPRVYYAFVGYKLPKKSKEYNRRREVVRDILASIEYVLVADSNLVAELIAESGSYDDDSTTPLSPMLGEWHAYHNVTKAKVREWASDPRGMLEATGRRRWRAPSLRARYKLALDALTQWGEDFEIPPCHVIHPCRRARVWTGPIPGSQVGFAFPLADPPELVEGWDDDNPPF